MYRRTALAAALLCTAGLALAQSNFPTKPITMIVPFPPGGLADIVGRPVAEAMSRELGQPVVIENKAAPAAASAWRRSRRRRPTATPS